MSEQDLLTLACESIERYVALGNQSFDAHDATFVRNRTTLDRHDANHVGLIRTNEPAELEALICRADLEFEGLPHRSFAVDALTPPQVEARLVFDCGGSARQGLCLVLQGELLAETRDCDIREVTRGEHWTEYAQLMEMWYVEEARKHGTSVGLNALSERVAYARAKAPAVRYWLAYVDDRPVGFFNSWPGENGVGQVEDLFTHPDFRRRGIATSLIAHCVADARARGAGPVLITAEPDDTPKQMYVAVAFRPLFILRNYVRRLDA